MEKFLSLKTFKVLENERNQMTNIVTYSMSIYSDN